MPRLIGLAAAALLGACADPAASASPSDETVSGQATYDPPSSLGEAFAWPPDEANRFAKVMVPGDPKSPRAFTVRTGPEYGVSDHDGAFADFLKDSGVQVAGARVTEPLERWTLWDGSDATLLLAETRYGGGEGVLFLYSSRKKGSDQYDMYGLEMPLDVYEAWGGIFRVIAMEEFLEGDTMASTGLYAKAPGMTLTQQADFYEQALGLGFDQLVMMAQGMLGMQAMQMQNALGQVFDEVNNGPSVDGLGMPTAVD